LERSERVRDLMDQYGSRIFVIDILCEILKLPLSFASAVRCFKVAYVKLYEQKIAQHT